VLNFACVNSTFKLDRSDLPPYFAESLANLKCQYLMSGIGHLDLSLQHSKLPAKIAVLAVGTPRNFHCQSKFPATLALGRNLAVLFLPVLVGNQSKN